ncbi:HPr family phosphocarrier protein [Aureibacillus halotolerans]|uniref:Catabolite repression HPr-like protein n=1 Tax=Aureibacillus halotolerans TaxID=1508390 RepID=A0A4R6TW89_9BACI|nr:HPr family phosphocarrier protein [Aureibacillus halotolerans]TDQ36982.1 catabolite repression HPr-like protein [Aureibacillus halotolerans]
MTQQQVTVQLKTGLRARPAAIFVQEANRFIADVYLQKGSKKVNAKSIMGLMSLAVGADQEVTISAEGRDEKEAVEALVSFVQKEDVA